MLRILIADDHELARRGIRSLLESHPGWEVCAEAKDGRDAVELATSLKPDLVLLDIGMPNLNGLEAARQILATSPNAAILILTMHDSDNVIREVLRAGNFFPDRISIVHGQRARRSRSAHADRSAARARLPRAAP